MKLLTFTDREEWLKWRQGGIGSSDAAIVMGVSEYKTRRELYEEKRALIYEEPPKNWAMQQGDALEPIALGKFNRWFLESEGENEKLLRGSFSNSFFEKINIEREDHPFLRYSIDGALGFPPQSVLEIKFQGKFDFMYQGVPDKNFWQIQHGFLVTKLTRGYFCGINRRHDIKVLDTYADEQAIADLFRECEKFWWHVTKGVPPEEL